jgi:hypothetical protein
MQMHINMIEFVDVKNQLCLTSMDKDNFPNIVALAFVSYDYEKLLIIYTIFIFTVLGKKESQ